MKHFWKHLHKEIHYASLYLPLLIIVLIVVGFSLLYTQIDGLMRHYAPQNQVSSTTNVQR